ncbi:MAG: hypothetical protein CK427_17065 [Leptospira sp.]|nr:MAG: hypothetical protein CK427_17065 [Leptospira sp.]
MQDKTIIEDLDEFLKWVEKWNIKSGMNDNEDFAGNYLRDVVKRNLRPKYLFLVRKQLEFLENGLYTGYDGYVPKFHTINILHSLAKDLIDLGWDRKLRQVKLKFSELRFYIENSSKEIEERISKLENLENTTNL